MSSQCDTGPLKKNIPAAMIAMIAATSMSTVNPCGNAAALEVTDDRTECEARWFARTYERIGDLRFNATERQRIRLSPVHSTRP
jgi:hypothetical protein